MLSMSPLFSVKGSLLRIVAKKDQNSWKHSEVASKELHVMRKGSEGENTLGARVLHKERKDGQSSGKALSQVWLEVRERGLRAGRQADSQWERRLCQSRELAFVPCSSGPTWKREITNYCT